MFLRCITDYTLSLFALTDRCLRSLSLSHFSATVCYPNSDFLGGKSPGFKTFLPFRNTDTTVCSETTSDGNDTAGWMFQFVSLRIWDKRLHYSDSGG